MKAKLYLNTISNGLRRPEVRVATLMLICAAFSFAQGTPQVLATAVGTTAKPWVYWLIRIVAAALSGGGAWSTITGLNGNEDGLMKFLKVFGGLIMMGVGIYSLGDPGTIYTTLNLDKTWLTT